MIPPIVKKLRDWLAHAAVVAVIILLAWAAMTAAATVPALAAGAAAGFLAMLLREEGQQLIHDRRDGIRRTFLTRLGVTIRDSLDDLASGAAGGILIAALL